MMVGFKGSLRGAGDTITAADAVAQMVTECILPRAAQVPAGGARGRPSLFCFFWIGTFKLVYSYKLRFNTKPNQTRH